MLPLKLIRDVREVSARALRGSAKRLRLRFVERALHRVRVHCALQLRHCGANLGSFHLRPREAKSILFHLAHIDQVRKSFLNLSVRIVDVA